MSRCIFVSGEQFQNLHNYHMITGTLDAHISNNFEFLLTMEHCFLLVNKGVLVEIQCSFFLEQNTYNGNDFQFFSMKKK